MLTYTLSHGRSTTTVYKCEVLLNDIVIQLNLHTSQTLTHNRSQNCIPYDGDSATATS